ncbi:TRAPP II complex [Macleaya cordata]|uniref:TRAPP II complex n=1 Tax=Macleaya cordata TaxID=56857 RepID=A0A200QM66_MACCD|nr:TRAPP II complex [Macleaya cordata]
MEPDVSIESGCMIRIAVVPIGRIPQAELREYVSMLVRHSRVELSAISSFYTEHQKSPFAHQPWDTGSLRLKFIIGGGIGGSPWEDFQSNRKILAVIGLCHCPCSPDLDLVAEQFSATCKDPCVHNEVRFSCWRSSRFNVSG